MPAVSVATPSWTLRMPQGTLQQWTFTFTEPGPAGVPYPISGATWEYVVRANAADTGVPLISITTALTSAGQITVTATASLSQVLLDILPAATAPLAPGTYAHALWINPSTSSQVVWFEGSLLKIGRAHV